MCIPGYADILRYGRPVTLSCSAAILSSTCPRYGHLIAEEIAKIDGFSLDPALGAASIRIAVSQLRGDS
jgi:hypothetical protein